MTITLPTDIDGYLDYKCPFCGRHFRLDKNLFESDDKSEMFCPYCGLKSEVQSFMPEEIKDFIEESVMAAVQKEFDDTLKNMCRKTKYLKISHKPGKKIVPKTVILDEYMSATLHCNDCDINIKVNDGEQVKHYCVCCGELKL